MAPDGSGMNEIVRWADAGMYAAEPIADEAKVEGHGIVPRVHLLWMTPDPLGAIAAMNFIYSGRVIRNLAELTDDDRRYHWQQVMNAHLEAPLECVKFHFLIEGVDRSFTHQMVRQRTAVYAQESLRFAVKEDAATEVVLPPHIAGLAEDDPKRVVWDRAVQQQGEAYNQLVNAGVPAEDARGLLPHATATRLHYITDLRGLKLHAGNRLCTQAQFHWRVVFAQIVNAIRNHGVKLALEMEEHVGIMTSPTEAPWNWQFEMISDSMLFRPVCFHLNRCPWQDDIAKTRTCSIKERVTKFAETGVPSTQWEDGPVYTGPDETGQWRTYQPAIRPEEWLANPDAAIRRPDGTGVKR